MGGFGVVSAVVVAQEATLRTKIFFAEFDRGPGTSCKQYNNRDPQHLVLGKINSNKRLPNLFT